jgi:hypothetical protein
MAATIPFKLKLFRKLYDLGMKGYGPVLIRELPRKTNEWADFAILIFGQPTEDEARKVALKQILTPGFVEKHPARDRLIPLIADLLDGGVGNERRQVIQFVTKRTDLFDTGSDAFQMKVIGLQRSGDPQLADAADALLAKLGIDMRDPELFRQGE